MSREFFFEKFLENHLTFSLGYIIIIIERGNKNNKEVAKMEKTMEKQAKEILKLKGKVTVVFNCGDSKTVNNMISLKQQFDFAEFFDGVKEVR